MSDKYRIMVVDDEDDTRTIIGGFLEEYYDVVFACNGADALAKLDAYEPDLVVLDALMPEMDGFATCEAIRRHPRFHNVVVVFLSCLHESDKVRRMYQIGANFYVSKPIIPERLLRNIAMSLRNLPGPAPKRHTLAELKDIEAHPPQAEAPPPPEPEYIEPSAVFGRAEEPASEPAKAHAPATRARLLMLKEDKSIRAPLLRPIEGIVDITAVDNAVEAVAWIIEAEPRLLVFDFVPCAESARICEKISRHPHYAAVSIAMLSAHLSKDVIRQCQRAGLDQLAPHTCDMGKMIATLEEIATPAPSRAQTILRRQRDVAQTGYIQTGWPE